MSNFSTNNHNSSQKPKRQRRTFTDEFKQDAVNLVVKEGYAIADGLWNVWRVAQRFRRVKGDQPAKLLDALIRWFPAESPEF